MIEVRGLTKRFVNTVAVNNISFEVREGEIVGFLGPNGAGKTTTMRMLTCFMPATSGQAYVDGLDIFTQSLEVRKRVGYMPENVPLYPEMRVEEYLNFRAKLKGVERKKRKSRVEEVIERCWLKDVRRKINGHLSKGYRQRVGLAECLVHNPKILILDEPTIGLDPAQIRATRKLIRELAHDHTVLLSTHILPEVEMTCERVIIINEGHIALQDSLENLIGGAKAAVPVRLEVKGPPERIKAVLETIPGVTRVQEEQARANTRFLIESSSGTDVREEISNRMARNGWPIIELTSKAKTLEEIFVDIVSRDSLQKGAAE